MTDELITAQAAQALARMHRLLSRAQAEAGALATASGWAFRDVALAGALDDLVEAVHLLLPAGAMPDVDTWPPEAAGTDPVDLLRQAQLVPASCPTLELAPATATVLADLDEAIRKFS